MILSAEESIGNGSYFYPWHHLKSVTEAEEHEFIVERMNREALGFIERNSDRPFFLYLSHYAVHTMVHGQPELVDYFRSKPGCSHSAPSKNNPENDPYKKWPADYLAKPHNPHLAAQLKVIDDGVGMIVEKLKELGIADNTIVIFTSDNGGSPQVTDNGPLRGGKGTLYEGGTREPMIVWQPGRICGGRVSELPTNNYDFYPTLCQLTGTPLPEGFEPDGASITDELLGTGKCDAERPLYWYFKIQGRKNGGRWCSSVRAGDWKLIEFHDTGERSFTTCAKIPAKPATGSATPPNGRNASQNNSPTGAGKRKNKRRNPDFFIKKHSSCISNNSNNFNGSFGSPQPPSPSRAPSRRPRKRRIRCPRPRSSGLSISEGSIRSTRCAIMRRASFPAKTGL